MSPTVRVTRAQALAIAEAYRTHRWRPTAANVKHGPDRAGIQVDTPDIRHLPGPGSRPGWWQPGEWNEGLPYQWGGFDTPSEFDRKIATGLAAGDIYTAAKRAALESAVSAEACGIDCSGLISRCWRLDRSYSTRELAALCHPLHDYGALRPGDILNLHNNHVLLFAGWEDTAHTRLHAYETGSPPTWKVLLNSIPVSLLHEKGYQPLRYTRMEE